MDYVVFDPVRLDPVGMDPEETNNVRLDPVRTNRLGKDLSEVTCDITLPIFLCLRGGLQRPYQKFQFSCIFEPFCYLLS